MTSPSRGIELTRLCFTGKEAETAELTFREGLNVLYGASNTGKSFAVKSLDFMLGSSRDLPEIEERRKYERAGLELGLPKSGYLSLSRALAGGAFEVEFPAGARRPTIGHNIRQLSARHDPSNTDNLSQFLLEELDLGAKSVAMDANGRKRSLSFRDLARFCIVDETSIQSETSPAMSGQYPLATVEHSVFKLLVTGTDDSAIVPVVDRKTFKASTAGKLEVIDEMITTITELLDADYPNADQLSDQAQRLEETWLKAQRELQVSQDSIRSRLSRKRQAADAISALEHRQADIEVNIGRFEQLEEVYRSDIQRLEAIEEAGFLLTLVGDKDCPLCGASPEAQRHVHGTKEIERVHEAAAAEITKIARQARDLKVTLLELNEEGKTIAVELARLDGFLHSLETELSELAPAADEAKQQVADLLTVRDQVRKGLALLEHRQSLQARKDELTALRPATKGEKPKLGVSSTTVHDFAQAVSRVLSDWRFPGERHVTFDEATYDLRIDGKHRKDNGKGVRAITHAAFKVALLLYCNERKIPHPGFLVLDTPLLTYRDPIHSRAGPLSGDEKELSATSLKDHFFQHLAEQADKGQFLVVENVDLPAGISRIAHVETFTGDPTTGRAGLFHH